jgi:phospholipase C
MNGRRLEAKVWAGVGLAAALVAGQVCAFALASGSAAPTDSAPPTTAPVTTVVAPTTTVPNVGPDQPPVPAKPKPKPKPKRAPKHAPTPRSVSQQSPATTTAPAAPAFSAPRRTTVTPSNVSPARSTTHASGRGAQAQGARERVALRVSHDRSASRKAAELKALLGPVPQPKYPLTAAGATAHPSTPIHHFVYLLQENHTFDNYFGTYGHGSDGIPKDVCMPINLTDKNAGCIKPFHLGGRAVSDLGHNPIIYRGQYNDGRMNGFANILRLQGVDPTEVMGYYDGRDIPYYWNLADNYVLFDHFFSSAEDGSGANHMFWVAGYPADPHDAPKGGFTRPTIFDRLEKARVSWKFYVSNYDPKITYRASGKGDRDSQVIWVPLLNYARFLDDKKLASHIVPLTQYYKDLANGTLPAVSYIAPSGASEHPPGSIQSGERFVRTLINNLMASSAWSSSAFLLAYDDWGGWYDHVRPPKVDAFGYGFRVPALLVSPYARHGYVDHSTLEFSSGLKFIEQNWGLEPLTRRDALAGNLTRAFDFKAAPQPARIISSTRGAATTPSPKRSVIYPAYGLGAGLVLLLIAFAFIRSRRNRARIGPAQVAGELEP